MTYILIISLMANGFLLFSLKSKKQDLKDKETVISNYEEEYDFLNGRVHDLKNERDEFKGVVGDYKVSEKARIKRIHELEDKIRSFKDFVIEPNNDVFTIAKKAIETQYTSKQTKTRLHHFLGKICRQYTIEFKKKQK